MKGIQKFSLRFGLYLLALAYLLCDLFIFNGPLNQQLRPPEKTSEQALAEAKKRGIVAQVFGHYIHRDQLRRAVAERLWLDGKSANELSPNELKLTRYAALGELIDYEILRTKVKVNSHELLVSDEEINARLKRFTERFTSVTELREAMQKQGIKDDTALRNWLAARIQQEKYVELRISPLAEVTEEEIRAFYEKHQAKLSRPERIRARHIFIPTLNTPSEIAKEKLHEGLRRLISGESNFQNLASVLSQDPATKHKGGELGWMSKARLPAHFAETAFDLEIGTPALISSKIGWHILEVTERKAAEKRTLAEMRVEIARDLNSAKRHQATEEFRTTLRKFEREKIHIFHDLLK